MHVIGFDAYQTEGARGERTFSYRF